MANANQLQVLDAIRGDNLVAIQSVMGAFQQRNLDIAQSVIDVLRVEGSGIIVVAQRSGAEGTDEGLGVRVETGAELAAQDLHFLRSGAQPAERLDGIHGSNFRAIQAAMDVFPRNLDVRNYNIEVVREGGLYEGASIVVIFSDKDRPAGTRGSTGRPGFEVELDAHDLRVLRSNYVR